MVFEQQNIYNNSNINDKYNNNNIGKRTLKYSDEYKVIEKDGRDLKPL